MRRRALYGKKAVPEEDKFKMTVSMAASETMVVPATSTSNDFMIDWGDGSAKEHVTTASPSHVYSVGGNYQISIWGSMPLFKFNNGGNKLNLISVEQSDNVSLSSADLMFYGCVNLTNVDSFDLSGITDTSFMFRGCTNLITLPDVLDLSSVTSIALMFASCTNLLSVPDILDLSNCTSTSSVFSGCASLTSLPAILDLSNCSTTRRTFRGCTNLTSFPSVLDLNSSTDTYEMFYGCSSIVSINSLINMNNTQVVAVAYMFRNCSLLECIGTELNTLGASVDRNLMFLGCASLLHPTPTEQADLIDVDGAVYSYTCQ